MFESEEPETQDNEGEQSEEAAEGGGDEQTHQIRFVARTLDGLEVASAPISLAPGPGSEVQAHVSIAYWGHAQYLPGQTAYACAAAHGADGAVVRFVILGDDGSSLAQLRGKVKDGQAVAEWQVPEDMAAGTKVKFRAETPFSKKTALPFAVGAPEKEKKEGGEEKGEGGTGGGDKKAAGGGNGKAAGGGDKKAAGGGGKPPASQKPAGGGKAAPRAAGRSPSGR